MKRKELSIRRLDIEKFCIAARQLLELLELNKKMKIEIEYDSQSPVVKFSFYSEL